MTFDISARNLTCVIDILDANGGIEQSVDFSDEVLSYDFASNQINTQTPNFLVTVRGTIRLGLMTTSINSLNSRDLASSPAGARIWGRGNRVRFQLADSTGTLQDLPFPLYILTAPQPPTLPNLEIEVQVGDITALQSYQQPEGDASDVEIGTTVDRTTLINRFLTEGGAPALLDPIPEYPFETYVQKNDTTPWVDFSGQMAAAAGYVMWQQTDGSLRASQIDLAQAAPTMIQSIFNAAEEFEFINNDERPPEELTVLATGRDVLNANFPKIDETRTYGNRGGVLGAQTTNPNADLTIYYQRAETNLTTDNRLITTTTISVPRIVVDPDIVFFQTALVVVVRITETKRFNGDTGAIFRYDRRERWLKGWINKQVKNEEFPPSEFAGINVNFDEIPYIDTKTIYRYDANDLLIDRDTEVRAIRAAWGDGLLPSEDFETRSLDEESWRNKGNNHWRHNISALRTIQELYDGDVGTADPFALTRDPDNSETTQTNSGEATPPQTERLPELYESTPVQYEGTVGFQPIGGITPQPKPETIEVRSGVVVSDAQASFLAQLLGLIRQGRSLGARFVDALPDWWLTAYQPLPRIDVTYLGVTTAYIVDGWSVAGDDQECVFGASLIETGVVSNGAILPLVTTVHRVETRIKVSQLARRQIILTTDPVETRIKIRQLVANQGSGGGAQRFADLTEQEWREITEQEWRELELESTATGPASFNAMTEVQWRELTESEWRNL